MPPGVPGHVHRVNLDATQIPAGPVLITLRMSAGLPVKIALDLRPQLRQHICFVAIVLG